MKTGRRGFLGGLLGLVAGYKVAQSLPAGAPVPAPVSIPANLAPVALGPIGGAMGGTYCITLTALSNAGDLEFFNPEGGGLGRHGETKNRG
jgi:hypothetical protein